MNTQKNIERTYLGHIDISLTFGDKTYTKSHLEYAFEQTNNLDFIEFLPGIFYKETSFLKNALLIKIVGLLFHHLPLLKIFYYKFDKLKQNNLYTTIYFKIANHRDTLHLTVNNETLFSNVAILDDQNEIDIYCEAAMYSIKFKTAFEDVPTSKILYPFTPGGDGSRCPVMGLFYSLGLIDSNYPFFSKHEMFYISALSDSLLDICRNFDSCKNNLAQYLDGSYAWPSEDANNHDNFRLTKFNGIYKVSNANHRVCCAKRFGIPFIHAQVIEYVPVTPHGQSESITGYTAAFDESIRITNQFHHTLTSLNLSAAQGQELLLQGLRGIKLLRYLESCIGNDLYHSLEYPQHQKDDL